MADKCSAQTLLLLTSASGDYMLFWSILKFKIEMVQPNTQTKIEIQFKW